MARGRTWTKEEIDYLLDRWGEVSVKGMANKLNRTPNSVKLKAYKIGLRSAVNYIDGVLIHHLTKEIGIPYSTIMYWIENKGFPAKRKLLVEEERYWYVNIDDFWKWAEKNKELINFAELEENILGAEPDWVKGMRKKDKNNVVKINSNKKFWTEGEEKRLISMLEEFKYTNTDIAKTLGRSEASVRRRIYDLGIKMRPISNRYKFWTSKEEGLLIEMYRNDYGLNAIAKKLNRSERSIRGKLERLQKVEEG